MSACASICPRFDHCDPRCGARMTLGHLDEVFRFCTSDFASCPVFRASGGRAVGIDGCSADGVELEPAGAQRDRFRLCDGPISDDVARLAGTCIERLAELTADVGAGLASGIARGGLVKFTVERTVELTIERTPLGRSVVA